jgi:hypothetical protein
LARAGKELRQLFGIGHVTMQLETSDAGGCGQAPPEDV